MKLGNLEASALEHFNRAIELKPDYAEAHHNRSAAWLLRENFERGLPEYEWRLRSRDLPPLQAQAGRSGRTSRWKAKRSCCAPNRAWVIRCNSSATPRCSKPRRTVIAGTLRKLHHALDAHAGDRPVDYHRTRAVPADFCVPMMSLPWRLRTTRTTIPTTSPTCSPTRAGREVAGLAEWLRGVQGRHQLARQSRVPWRPDALDPAQHLAPWPVPGVRLVSLQKGAGRRAARRVPRGLVRDRPADELDKEAGAFMDTAAIVKASTW